MDEVVVDGLHEAVLRSALKRNRVNVEFQHTAGGVHILTTGEDSYPKVEIGPFDVDGEPMFGNAVNLSLWRQPQFESANLVMEDVDYIATFVKSWMECG